jgi:hypothetical protein
MTGSGSTFCLAGIATIGTFRRRCEGKFQIEETTIAAVHRAMLLHELGPSFQQQLTSLVPISLSVFGG